MLVSHKYKFIFLKSFKTASSSTYSFFTPYCIDPKLLENFDYNHALKSINGITGITEFGIVGVDKKDMITKNFNHALHVKAHKARKYLNSIYSGIWRDYFKFVTVRNPWDMCVSNYFFRKFRHEPDMKFSDFISRIYEKNHAHSSRFYRIKNNYFCDYYIRFENLKDGIKEVCEKIGIKDFNLDNLVKKHSNYRPKGLHYSKMYDENTKRMVYELFRKDIKKFDYKFEWKN